MSNDNSQPTLADYITCAQAARLVPGKPAPATIWRWATHGVRGVQLQHLRPGGRVYTTTAWLQAFIAATTQSAARSPRRSMPARPARKARKATPVQRQKQIDYAMRELSLAR